MRTVRLEDGKYEVDVDNYGQVSAVRRNGEDWLVVMDQFRFSKLIAAMVNRIIELEDADHWPDGRTR